MKRGDIVLLRGPEGPAGKPRPCIVVQRTSTLDESPKVTLCPLGSTIRVDATVRPLVNPTPGNGLRRVSQIETDWICTCPLSRLGPVIGTLDDATMQHVDRALRLWLDL